MPVGQSWGRYPAATQAIVQPTDRANPALPRDNWLPFGNGRSYGDSCLNDGGTLVHTRWLDHFMDFDAATGILRCEAGVQLADILALVVPQGWFLPVSPGTQYVTVGGAIANDVHGKNHHAAGTFGEHVRQFVLLRSDGSRLDCSPAENAPWFRATIGGLGLTGLITSADLQLRRILGPWLNAQTSKFDCLDGFFGLSAESDSAYEYTVAWIDCTARGTRLGRGLFSRANHAAQHGPAPPARRARSLPFTPPVSLVNTVTLRAFNTLYWQRQRRRQVARTTHYQPFFYPLDALSGWNRMYGPAGFLQYQCVVPPAAAPRVIGELLRRIQASGSGSFLAVLKQFGDRPPAAGGALAPLAAGLPDNATEALKAAL